MLIQLLIASSSLVVSVTLPVGGMTCALHMLPVHPALAAMPATFRYSQLCVGVARDDALELTAVQRG